MDEGEKSALSAMYTQETQAKPLIQSSKSVHDWHTEKRDAQKFYDDGTMTYFWRGHTLTALLFLVGFLLYEAFWGNAKEDFVDNTKRGIFAVVSSFILLGVTVTSDGPFKRPHPAFWRLVFNCSIVYELALIFVLCQNGKDARKLLKHLDHNLGEILEEKDYGGNCLIYDSSHAEHPFHNVWEKMDLFVPLHFFGWWLKALLLRDWWLCWFISIMFEVLEYTLEHQLPNFSECWWDHWIMDALVCNGLGIYFGIKTINYFSMKSYHWRGLLNIPSYRGKLHRIMAQFGPYVWIDYEWEYLTSLGRWFSVLAIVALFCLTELNTFYLKFVLWIPPGHWVNLSRIILIMPCGAVAIREIFQYLDDPDCSEFGRQSWIFLAIISTEFLLVIKFGWETLRIPFPRHVVYLWVFLLVLLVAWTVWNFYIDPHTVKMSPTDIERKRERWNHLKAIETKLSPSENRFVLSFFENSLFFRKNQSQSDKNK